MKLQVLTFNCWGVPAFSQDRAPRMRAIGQVLASSDLDVVGLQEVFSQEDRQTIARAAASGGLVHTHYFPSGLIGSGLFTLSRFPIETAGFQRFRLNGRAQDLARSDYYAGKGVGYLRLQTPIGALCVFNSHFIAPYLEIGPDVFFAHRVAQALETANYIQNLSGDVPAILLSDINSTPDSLVYSTLLELAGLDDTYRIANPGSPGITVTEDIPYISQHSPERIDYVFSRSGNMWNTVVLSSDLAMTGLPDANPEDILAYSDHYGVRTELEIRDGLATTDNRKLVDGQLLDRISTAFECGISNAREAQVKAGVSAGLASITAAVLVGLRGQSNISRRQFLNVMAAVGAGGLVAASGLGATTAICLNHEIEVIQNLQTELRQGT